MTRLTRTIALSAWVGLAAAACGRVETYAMNQPIAMGPYTFAVVAATEGKKTVSLDGSPFRSADRSRPDGNDQLHKGARPPLDP